MSFFLRAENAGLPPGVHTGSTLRYGLGTSPLPFDRLNLGNCGAAEGDSSEQVWANRAALREALVLPAEPFWLRQVHGIAVANADAVRGTDTPEADAAVTRCAGVVLAVLHADCLPIVLWSDDGDVLGAAHAGWRGLAAGVAEATVAAMGATGARLSAWLGPAAGPAAYEVGEEVREAFVAHDRAAAQAFVPTRAGHWRVDLYALARQRLQAVGVTRVTGGEHCTISEPARFFSHRRDARTGRMASLIWRA